MPEVAGRFRYAVVEGPIGVGKTSLARRLAEHFDCELILERPMDNPFLARFYADPRSAALPTQLHFLFQRSRQAQELRQNDLFAPVRVADFLLDKDRLFAQLTLDDDELRLYEMVFEKLSIDAPQPDVVIYLQAGVQTLLERVRQRGVDYEQSISADYLARLSEAYTRFFHHYDAAPLLIVNTDNADLVAGDEYFNAVLEQLRRLRAGRQFYNPGQLSTG